MAKMKREKIKKKISYYCERIILIMIPWTNGQSLYYFQEKEPDEEKQDRPINWKEN